MPWYTIDHPYKLSVVAARMMSIADTGVGTTPYAVATTGSRVAVGPAGAGDLQGKLFTQGWMANKELMGIPVKASANIIPDANADTSGASFSKEGLIYVNEVSPRIDPDTSDKSYRGAVELNGWCSYAWGTWRPATMGVEIFGNSSQPTS